MFRYIFLLAALSTSALASIPRYSEPQGSPTTATLVNYSQLVLCKINGPRAPNGARACQTRVLLIDGAKVKHSSQVRLASGQRRIRLFCMVQHGPRGTPSAYSQDFDVDVQAGQTYQAEPYWDEHICSVRYIDSAGNQLPMAPVRRPLDA